ncbi:MAG: NAD(P)/FAD-dependent oxidoreductase [Myxococcota bacterium]
MRAQKIVIVGAGPAGSACALALARSTRSEIVMVDKSQYPRRKVCGSGLSPVGLKVLDGLGLIDELTPHHVHLRNLRAVGPDGGDVMLQGAKGAWVVPRVILDHTIVRAAVNEGVELREDTKVVDVVRDAAGNARGVKTKDGEIEADFVIFANGSPSRFEQDTAPRYGIRTIMGWWKARLPDDGGMMVWDRRLDGYYAWAFPEPDGITNIGLTIREDLPEAKRLKDLFNELLEDHFSMLTRHGDQVGKWMGHPATVTTRVGPITESHALYIGEAARLVCPATVEGIAFAMKSGVLAADVLAKHQRATGSLSRFAQHRYRLNVARAMLPSFIAAETFYRFIRNDTARGTVARFFDAQSVADRLSTLVGAVPDEHKNRTPQPAPSSGQTRASA